VTPKLSPQLAREKPDPWESSNPLPVLFLAFFAGVAVVAVIYLARNVGADAALGGDRRSAQRLVVTELTPAAAYQKSCAGCHQANGLGVAGAFPPLAASPWLLEDRETPIRVVLLGLSGPIEVAGKSYSGVMPAFGPTLADREIALALTHARTSFGNQAAAITADEVAQVRASLAGRSEPWAGGAALEEARRTRVLP
jgi:mono/diheme cytochrome c family protein